MGCGGSTQSSPKRQQKQQPATNTAANGKEQDAVQQNQGTVNHSQVSVQPAEQSKTDSERKVYTQDQTDIEVKKVEINADLLKQYVDLEKEARTYEEKNVLKNLSVKVAQQKDLENTIKQLDEHHKLCVYQTKKEKQDVDQLKDPSVRNFFKDDKTSFDTKFSKEQEEYLEALNKEEVAKKDLDGVTKQQDTIAKEIQGLQVEADKLQAIYKQQDELLAGIFNGKYGSEHEYKLESELDLLLDRRQRIAVAKYKWGNARVLVHHACTQLAFSVRRWQDLPKVQESNIAMRYTIATETRNNLIAATQNINNAQRYLNTIQFPYCKSDEMTTLTKATSNIYADMQTTERHAHALECFTTTHKRAAALIQWMDHVIKNTITKDFQNATDNVNAKDKELRSERLRLIKEKIKEVDGGANVDIDEESENYRNELTFAEEKETVEADCVSAVGDLPGEAGEGGMPVVGDKSQGETAPTLSEEELAPLPSQEDLFGDIAEIKAQHVKDMAEFDKAQDVNKTRMEQGLEEKLRARRSRRMRQEMNQTEKEKGA